jgi:signal transduction histidine kinase
VEAREVSGEAVGSSSVDEALALARRLQIVSARLAETQTAQQVLDAVLDEGLEAAGAVRGMIAMLDAEANELEIVAWYGYKDETMHSWARFPLVDDLPLSRAVLRSEPVFLRSSQERDEAFPALAGRSEDGHALACLPLVVEGRPVGGLVLSFAEDEDFSDERRRFKTALAHQVAQALERARLLDTEQTLRSRMAFLARAGYLLSSSLDYRRTLSQLAQLAVPDLADWCSVDMLSEDGAQIERLAVAHFDPSMVAWAQELGDRYPPDLNSPYGVANALRTGEPEFMPSIADELLVAASEGDEELLVLLRRLELRSAITVPLVARGRPLGALSLIRSSGSPPYAKADLELALELALRAAQAVDNALLLRETQRQADAARALSYVADGVVLVDDAGVIRHWNAAAERLTGLSADQVIGHPGERFPAWVELVENVPVDAAAPVMVLPFANEGVERWLAVRAVVFDEGAVFALRDVTADRELERLRSEFVATASHELRTPLASIYGAIRSLRRTDIAIAPEQHEQFMSMIESESEKLRVLVDQLLIAGRLDAGAVDVSIGPVELGPIVDDIVRAAAVSALEAIALRSSIEEGLVVSADAGLLRQVLANLVDNAVKYSPAGGLIEIKARRTADRVTIRVVDRGIGIPADQHRRIFEKFFRVDPGLRLGVGGTGLGLYIAKELTEQMRGRLIVDSALGAGSTFTIDLPGASMRRSRKP